MLTGIALGRAVASALLAALPAVSGTPDWGFYQILWRPDQYARDLDHQLEMLGGRPKYALFFRDLVRPFPLQAVRAGERLGLVSIVSLELEVWGRGPKPAEGGGVLAQIAGGGYDGNFREWARAAAAYGKRVIYRFGFEMNGDWFPWGGRPAEFQAAWRHVHKIFREQGASNVEWMFCPNVLWDDRTPESDFAPYYPGDAYVDLMGLDGYNFGDRYDAWHRWQGYEEVFAASVAGMARFGKPLFLGEVGCARDPRRPAWMRDFLERVSLDGRVQAFVYFNYDKSREGEPHWSLEGDAESLRVFRRWNKGSE